VDRRRIELSHAELARQRCAPALSPKSRRRDSNSPPPAYEAGAHPAVLRRPNKTDVPPTRFERALAGLSTRRLYQLGYEDALRRGFEPRSTASRARRPAVRRPENGPAGPVDPPAGRPAPTCLGAGSVQRRVTDAHVGTVGSIRRTMPASAGVRLSLRWLQPSQAATVLSQVLRPPRDVGTRWSTVVAVRPQ
jgi:hypothetical protein